MAWFKVDDGFANSRPILAIPRRYRASAAGLWVLAGTWSAKELTDGFIPEYVLGELASTPAIAAHLVAAGLWTNVPGGYQLIGWAKYQFTKEQVLARRTAEAEKKRRARDAARKASDQRRGIYVPEGVPEGHDGESPSCPPGSPVYPVPSTRPDPTRTNLSLVNSKGGVALVDAPEPPRQCESHINDPTPPRCGRCGDARKANDAWAAQRKAKRDLEMTERRNAIDDCGLCDDNGLRETQTGAAHCDHAAAINA